jgi:hypothetical protein
VGYIPRGTQSHIQEERVMKIIHWIGIDDHADKWTIAHFKGNEEKPAKEWELVPDEKGYRTLIAYAKGLEGEVRIVYEAGPCGYELYRRLTKARLQCQVAAPTLTPQAGRPCEDEPARCGEVRAVPTLERPDVDRGARSRA